VSRESHVVAARTHGRYHLRPPAGAAAGILVGFHGYMEDGERHLAALESIPGLDAWALVAIDALHAFYARSAGDGRVVRGWMTRDLRAESIADNVDYARGIFECVRARFGWRLPLVALGFSQGASMAWRAALLAGHEVAAVVALAGDVPPELAELPPSTPFPPHALLARGAADEWYDAAKLAADCARLAGRAVAIEELVFAGGHEWSDEFRRAAGELIARTAAAGGT
jgi:predicted esterase